MLERIQSKPLWIKVKSQQGARNEFKKPLSIQIFQESWV